MCQFHSHMHLAGTTFNEVAASYSVRVRAVVELVCSNIINLIDLLPTQSVIRQLPQHCDTDWVEYYGNYKILKVH